MELASKRVVDLTYRLTADFPLFPVYDPIRVADKFTLAEQGFYVRSWAFDEHCGTHVDAPAHFSEDGDTVDRIPAEELVLEVAVLDVSERVAGNHDLLVSPDDVLAWESRHGPLPERCALFAHTGWASRVRDTAAYLNADDQGVMHTPGFSPELTEFLKQERPGVRGIGLDTGNLDAGIEVTYPAHSSWLPSGRWGIENLANLSDVPPRGAIVVVGVPPVEDGSGFPARVLAFVA
jgi:kynurenine formamidase